MSLDQVVDESADERDCDDECTRGGPEGVVRGGVVAGTIQGEGVVPCAWCAPLVGIRLVCQSLHRVSRPNTEASGLEGRGVGLAVDVLADVLCTLGLCHAHHADAVVAVRRGEVHALTVEGVGDAVAGGLGVVHTSMIRGMGSGVNPER